MRPCYDDILEKLGPAEWFDENGVPRYCTFAPDRGADIYAREIALAEIALAEIACQSCRTRFKAAISIARNSDPDRNLLARKITCRSISYGDPPSADCCEDGATMTADVVEILEYWKRPFQADSWTRDHTFEIRISETA